MSNVHEDEANDDELANRKKRWRVRRFAERRSYSNNRRQSRRSSISSESNSSNAECKPNHSVACQSHAIWSQKTLEDAIEHCVGPKANERLNEASDSHIKYGTLLSATLNGNLELLAHLLDRGVDANAADNEGRSALHYATCSTHPNAIECASTLIENGASVNAWDKNSVATPLICAASIGNSKMINVLLSSGADVDAGLNKGVSTALLWAVRTRDVDCVGALLRAGATVNTYQVYSEAPVHVASAQGDAECLRLLLDRRADVRVLFGPNRNSALHLAAEEGHADCIGLLLQANADANVRNSKGQTPLHLAILSHSIESIALLLKAGSDPNAADEDVKTPLHSAVIKSSRSRDIVRLLIAAGASINAQDCYGYTPLHLAAINENSKVAASLILSGADWSLRTKGGINAISLLIRRTPDALKAIPHRFDSALNVAEHDPLDHDCELYLDFRKLTPSSGCEANLLMALVNGGQRQFLQHPVVRAFLHVKWTKIRSLFIASFVFHVVFVAFLTAYIVSAFVVQGRECPPNRTVEQLDQKETFHQNECLFSQWPSALVVAIQYSNIVLGLMSAVKEIFQLLQKPGEYVRNVENCIHFVLIIAVVAINLPRKWNRDHWQEHVSAVVIVVAWAELMMHVGRFPGFGIYVQMFATVATNIAKFLAAYVSLIIGFSLSFAILYPDTKSLAKLPYSLVSTIVMMTGELDYNEYFSKDSQYPVTSHVVFLVFLLFIVIVLMNLLVGLAVSDIQGLQKSARLNRLKRQILLIARMESILFSSVFNPFILRKRSIITHGFLQRKILVVPPPYRQIYNVRPNDPRDSRFSLDIKEALLKTLIAKKSVHSSDDRDLSFFRKSQHELVDDKLDEILETLNKVLVEIRRTKCDDVKKLQLETQLEKFNTLQRY